MTLVKSLRFPELCAWMKSLEEEYAYLSVLLETTATLQILMFSQIPWKREGVMKKTIVGDPEARVGFMLESGMTAFVLLHGRDSTQRPLPQRTWKRSALRSS